MPRFSCFFVVPLRCLVLAAAMPGLLFCAAARAAYPEHQVTIVVPFAPGGGSDIAARVLSKYLTEDLKQPFLVDNRAGAGGNIAARYVAQARPDGYTLMVISSILTINPSLYKNVAFDPMRDFTPIVEIGDAPNVIVTRPDSGIKSVAELIAQAKAKPDLLNYANPGSGTSPHIAMEYFKVRAGINITNVPYSGAGPSMQAVLGGSTQLGCFSVGAVAPHIQSGRLRALVHTGHGRMAEFPEVPNMAQAGFANAESASFQVLVAPAGLAPEITAQLSRAVLAVLKRPDVQETMRNNGFGIIGGGPEQLKARIAHEVPMYREMIARARIKVD
jgi:tripartite-type tricarboxylate transporter receptor subunit TctC